MKSTVQNGSDQPLYLAALGVVLAPGRAAVVADSPAIVAQKLGEVAQRLHVTQVPDTYASTTPSGYLRRAGGRVASDGTLQAGSANVSGVVRNGTGSYTITLSGTFSAPASATLANAVALAAPFDDLTLPSATAVAAMIDSTHVQVATTSPVSGAPVDSAFTFQVIDFP